MTKNNVLKVLAVSGLAAVASVGHADNGYQAYVSLDAGYSAVDTKLTSSDINTTNKNKGTNSAVFGGTVGYYASSQVRTDLSVHYNPGDKFTMKGNSAGDEKVKSKLRTFTTLLNGYYDFSNLNLADGMIVPYVGVGVGFDHLDLKDVDYLKSDGSKNTTKSAKGDSKFKFTGAGHVGTMFHIGGGTTLSLQGTMKTKNDIKSKKNGNSNRYTAKNDAEWMLMAKLGYNF